MTEDRSLEVLFRPTSIAVVGASREPGSIGRILFENLLRSGFRGPVYPVNPRAREIHSVRAYPSVLDIPDPVDLAIIVVPARHVLHVVHECGQKGVRGLIVISAGFREIGPEGAKREARLKQLLQQYRMRAIGPNCMGVLNTDPAVRMNATFSAAEVPHGKIAFISQSGALGMAILDMASELHVGLSYFVSLGNKVNVSGNDLLTAWRDDPNVEVILMYLESFGNPQKFVRLAREITREKPIIAVKSGRTLAGARAAQSHTGALAERDVLTEALFEQCGVVRARTIEELFAYARVFSGLPRPRGRRVFVLTNSGGPGILATDALTESGFQLPQPPENLKKDLQGVLPAEASFRNPLDMTAGVGPEQYGAVLGALEKYEDWDLCMVIYTPPVGVDEEAVARAIADRLRGKPAVACIVGRSVEDTAFRVLVEAGIPTFTFPETATRALRVSTVGRERARRPPEEIPVFEVPLEGLLGLLRETWEAGEEWLDPLKALEFVERLGIPVPKGKVVNEPEEACAVAAEMRFPVVLKALVPGILHKTEAGAVHTGLYTEDQVRAAFVALQERFRGKGFRGVLVQEQVTGGQEVIIGVTRDPKFGPLIMFGLGGVYVEVLRDVVFRLAPLTAGEAERMVQAIRGYPLLTGYRGRPRADVEMLLEALLRVSWLVSRVPAIAELEINPLIVLPEGRGVAAVDARIRVWKDGEPPPPPAALPELEEGFVHPEEKEVFAGAGGP